MINLQNLTFKFFADCIPIKGHKRGVIYDLNRGRYQFIPNSLVDFCIDAEGKCRNDIKLSYSKEFYPVVDEYLSFLETNEFIYWMPEVFLKNFPKLNLEWDYPAIISNGIIDIDETSTYNIINVLQELENLGCKHIQIRSYCNNTLDFYSNILTSFSNSQYLSFEIVTPYYELEHDIVRTFINEHKRIKAIVFHSAFLNKIINEKSSPSMGNIAYTLQQIKSPKDCHNNGKAYFNVSIPVFTEAQCHHTYYNRKVSIDVNGNIKNCSSHEKKFGNIKTDKIKDVILDTNFQKLWFVTKDKTQVCKDCEFRFMCVDSRLPIEKDKNNWFCETECNYNPYIAKWKGEEGYITVNQFKNQLSNS